MFKDNKKKEKRREEKKKIEINKEKNFKKRIQIIIVEKFKNIILSIEDGILDRIDSMKERMCKIEMRMEMIGLGREIEKK